MKIKTVTITGADDRTNHLDLIKISERFPFVEWGILFSPKRKGESRYPTSDWAYKLNNDTKGLNMNFSAHLCGGYTKDLVQTGLLAVDGLIYLLLCDLFKRKQLNFNSSYLTICDAFYSKINLYGNIIIQHNKANAQLCSRIISECESIKENNIDFLYDGSGGRGVLPNQWQGVVPNHFTGYAGGLNPDNLSDALKTINEAVGDNTIWIDTETGVRTNDVLDLDKVVKFLEVAEKYTK